MESNSAAAALEGDLVLGLDESARLGSAPASLPGRVEFFDSETSDLDLARLASEGDLSAFELIYNRHNRRVYSLCLRMTASQTEAEDLTQEVLSSSSARSAASAAIRLFRPGFTG